MKRFKNQHQWGVIAQCANPYREFSFCPLCNSYIEWGTGQRMTRKQFKVLSISLANTDNPMCQADSKELFIKDDDTHG